MMLIFVASLASFLVFLGLFVIFGGLMFLTPLAISWYISHSINKKYYWISCAAIQKTGEDKVISAGLSMVNLADMAHSAITSHNIYEEHLIGMFMMHHGARCQNQFCPITLAFAELSKCSLNKEILKGTSLKAKLSERIRQSGENYFKKAVQANESSITLKLLYINFLIEYIENYTYVWFLIEKIKESGSLSENCAVYQFK